MASDTTFPHFGTVMMIIILLLVIIYSPASKICLFLLQAANPPPSLSFLIYAIMWAMLLFTPSVNFLLLGRVCLVLVLHI